jgi:hypothetical protein
MIDGVSDFGAGIIIAASVVLLGTLVLLLVASMRWERRHQARNPIVWEFGPRFGVLVTVLTGSILGLFIPGLLSFLSLVLFAAVWALLGAHQWGASLQVTLAALWVFLFVFIVSRAFAPMSRVHADVAGKISPGYVPKGLEPQRKGTKAALLIFLGFTLLALVLLIFAGREGFFQS